MKSFAQLSSAFNALEEMLGELNELCEFLKRLTSLSTHKKNTMQIVVKGDSYSELSDGNLMASCSMSWDTKRYLVAGVCKDIDTLFIVVTHQADLLGVDVTEEVLNILPKQSFIKYNIGFLARAYFKEGER